MLTPEFPRLPDGRLDEQRFLIPSDQVHPNREYNRLVAEQMAVSLGIAGWSGCRKDAEAVLRPCEETRAVGSSKRRLPGQGSASCRFRILDGNGSVKLKGGFVVELQCRILVLFAQQTVADRQGFDLPFP